ncbi:MAG: flagellar basal body-associated FliL family protein [Beijerinckiaceae bacterium]
MADTATAADDDGAATSTAGQSKKKLMMIALAAVVALAMAGGVWWFLLRKKPEPVDAHAPPKEQVGFVEMREMTINLAQAQGVDRQNYLKLRIALEVADGKMIPKIQPLLPRIEDAFQTYLRELRPNELEGSAAVIRLKEELLKRTNIAVYPAKVDAVLFKEVLMQ